MPFHLAGLPQTPHRRQCYPILRRDSLQQYGESTVSFLGPTTERAFEGRKSLKLDVLLKSGSHHYWGLAIRVPCAGEVKLSARILVAEGTTAQVGFGTNFVFPPTHHAGCGAVETFSRPTGDWKRVECDLVARGREGAAGVMADYAPTVRGDGNGKGVGCLCFS